jgi:hypothetical protein
VVSDILAMENVEDRFITTMVIAMLGRGCRLKSAGVWRRVWRDDSRL